MSEPIVVYRIDPPVLERVTGRVLPLAWIQELVESNREERHADG